MNKNTLKILSFITILVLLANLPIFAYESHVIEYGKTKNVDISLPDGWYIENQVIYNENGRICGGVECGTYEDGVDDLQAFSVAIFKTRYYNNIIHLKELNSQRQIFSADDINNDNMYVISVLGDEATTVFTVWIFSSRTTYGAVESIAANIAVSINTAPLNEEYLQYVNDYLFANNTYEIIDEFINEFYTIMLLEGKDELPKQKLSVVYYDGSVDEITVYPFENSDKYSTYAIQSVNEETNILYFSRHRGDVDMTENFYFDLAEGTAKFVKDDTDAMTAKPGTPIGYIYATDIKAYIDDMPIESYNINGKTAVIVEDLVNYGFKVKWDGELRTLTASAAKLPDEAAETELPENLIKIGTKLDMIYSTDIVTVINGHEYETYNLNGRTAIALEDIALLGADETENIFYNMRYSSGGFKAVWDGESREIKLYCLRPGGMVKTVLGEMYTNADKTQMTTVDLEYINFNLVGSNDEVMANAYMIQTYGEYLYVELIPFLEMLEVSYVFTDNTLTINNSAMKPINIKNYVSQNYTESSEILFVLKLNLQCGTNFVGYEDNLTAYYFDNGKIMVDLGLLTAVLSQ